MGVARLLRGAGHRARRRPALGRDRVRVPANRRAGRPADRPRAAARWIAGPPAVGDACATRTSTRCRSSRSGCSPGCARSRPDDPERDRVLRLVQLTVNGVAAGPPEHGLGRVDHADHVGLLRGAVEPGGTWADVGAGSGAFTLALADLLGPGGRIVAVDRDAAALRENAAARRAAVPRRDDRGPRGRPRPGRSSSPGSTVSWRPTASTSSRRDRQVAVVAGACGAPASGWPFRRRRIRRRSRQPVGPAPVQLSLVGAARRGRRPGRDAPAGPRPSRFLGAIYAAASRRTSASASRS